MTRREDIREAQVDTTAVVSLGIDSRPLLPGESEPIAVADAGTAGLDGVFDVVAHSVHDDRPVLAIVPTPVGGADEHAMFVTRALLERRRIALHMTSLPPLAATVLVELAAALSTRLRIPGMLACALPKLEQELLHIARMSTVSGLRSPGPSVIQHGMSLIPGIGFATCSFPELDVRRVRKLGGLPFELPEPKGSVTVCIAAPARFREALLRDVTELRPTRVVEIEGLDGTAAWAGTRRVGEVVAFPDDMDALANGLLRRLRPRQCGWCGDFTTETVCPVCSMLAPETANRTLAPGRPMEAVGA